MSQTHNVKFSLFDRIFVVCGSYLTNFPPWYFYKSKAIINETNVFGFKLGLLEYLFLSFKDASGYQDESEVEENDSEVINIVLLSP